MELEVVDSVDELVERVLGAVLPSNSLKHLHSV